MHGNIIIPPFGVNQRRYKGVLGTRRLVLGDGYGIHGTNAPETIGRSVSHGCVRLRNEDIEKLYEMVPVGTPGQFVYQPLKIGSRGGAIGQGTEQEQPQPASLALALAVVPMQPVRP